MSIMRRIVSIVAKRKARETDYVLGHPVEVTEDLLSTILKRNQDTVIGRKYRFETISSPEKFTENVPLTDYQKMRPILEEVYKNPTGKIMTAEPVIWYLRTSGSSGKPKDMPITPSGLKTAQVGGARMWMAFMNHHPDNTKILDGRMIMLGAPAIFGDINGVPLGYGSGLYLHKANKVFARLISPGQDVFAIQDMEEKMRAYALCCATCDVTALQGIATLILAFVRRMEEQYGPWLLEQLKGTKHEKRIRRATDSEGKIDLAELWPNLRLFGSGGIDIEPYREWIAKILPQVTVREGYASSEAYMASQILPEPGIQLMPDLNYFEFIPEAEIDNEEPTVIPLSDVKKGNRYEMLLTNANGWYRYRVGDMVTFSNLNPYTVRHISRKGSVVSLAGEKLCDAHVIDAMAKACLATGAHLMDYSVVGVIDGPIPHYTIAGMFRGDVDSVDFVKAFEDALGKSNWEFLNSRAMGGLGPTTLAKARTSLHEELVKATHLQAKPVPLTMDRSVLAMCEAT